VPDKKIEPWFTEEYAKERDAIIRKIEAEEKYWGVDKELLKEIIKEQTKKLRDETLKLIDELGPIGYIKHSITKLQEEMLRLQNPTEEDEFKYTDAYFRDMLKVCHDGIDFYESLLEDEKAAQKFILDYKKQLLKMEELILAEEKLQNYNHLPNSPITKFIKNLSIAKSNTKATKIPINKNAKFQETIDLERGRGIYLYINKNEKYEIVFDDLKILRARQNIGFRKTLNFILIKANEQNIPRTIYFDLEEYQKMAGYKNKDTAFRAAKKNFENLRGLSIGGRIVRNKKEIRNKTSYVFISKDISYNQCYIECKPELVNMLCQYFTLLPTWAGELNTKAYDLLDYIFYMARQKQNLSNIKKNKSFNISLKSINENIGGHDPTKTSRHTEYIIDPILNAIEEIEEKQKGEGIKITPIYDHNYKNAYDFLEGYLEIQLGEEATNYFINLYSDNEKQLKKNNKSGFTDFLT